MVTNKDETKPMRDHISCDCKWKFNGTTCNSNQKWNNKIWQCKCKSYFKYEKGYSWNPSTCDNSKYLKGVSDTSVTKCDEISIAMDIVSKKKINTIATKNKNTIAAIAIAATVATTIFHTVVVAIILILIIIIICYYYVKQN